MLGATQAQLYLNDRCAGTVVVRGHDNAWWFGEFVPGDPFADFAPWFGQWSLLMHADGDDEPMSEAASEELRQIECKLDGLRARLYLPDRDQWLALSQVNIDGTMIEWKLA